jgi:predicted ABC-type ATPase
MRHFVDAAALADYVIVFDNSGTEMVAITEREAGNVFVKGQLPDWARHVPEALHESQSTLTDQHSDG